MHQYKVVAVNVNDRRLVQQRSQCLASFVTYHLTTPGRKDPARTVLSIDVAGTLAKYEDDGNLTIPPANIEALLGLVGCGYTVVINTSETYSTIWETLMRPLSRYDFRRLNGKIFHILPECGREHYEVTFSDGRMRITVHPTDQKTGGWLEEGSHSEAENALTATIRLLKPYGYSAPANNASNYQFQNGTSTIIISMSSDWFYVHCFGTVDSALFINLSQKIAKRLPKWETHAYNKTVIFATAKSKHTALKEWAQRIAGLNKVAKDFIDQGIQHVGWIGDGINDLPTSEVNSETFANLLSRLGYFVGPNDYYDLIPHAHDRTAHLPRYELAFPEIVGQLSIC